MINFRLIFKKVLPYLISILLIAIAGASIFFYNRHLTKLARDAEPKLISYQNKDFGFDLNYQETFVEGKISDDQKKGDSPVILRLVRTDPPELITIWQESGLGALDLSIKKPLLVYLKENVDNRYSTEYSDFKKEKLDDAKIAGLDGFSALFTFQDKSKSYREKINLYVFIKDKAAYYIQCMSPEQEWSKAEKSCDIIKDSFHINK